MKILKLWRKRPAYEDLHLDILSGRIIDIGLIHYVQEAENTPLVWEAVEGEYYPAWEPPISCLRATRK